MLLPDMQASRSLYRSLNTYAVARTTFRRPWSSSGGYGLPAAMDGNVAEGISTLGATAICDDQELSNCIDLQEEFYRSCLKQCDRWCGDSGLRARQPQNPDVVCGICQTHLKECCPNRAAGLAKCRADYGCDAGLECVREWNKPWTRCCPTGQEACGGQCVDPCPQGRYRRADCSCACVNTTCDPPDAPKRVNPDTCQCECISPCPEDRVQDPTTCACVCDDRQPDICFGKCTNLADAPTNCGVCGHTCASDEICCQGQCVVANTDPNCGLCGTDCSQVGRTCCENGGQFFCSALTDDSNCGACNVGCAWPRRCTAVDGTYRCECPVTQPDCGDGACCAGQCCAGRCFTAGMFDADNDHCGTCDTRCTKAGTRCQAGKCACDPQLGLVNCGSGPCCPKGKCCGGWDCCEAGETCISGGVCCPTHRVCTKADGTKVCCGDRDSCCATGCHDLNAFDAGNCGACGRSCLGRLCSTSNPSDCVDIGGRCDRGNCVCDQNATTCPSGSSRGCCGGTRWNVCTTVFDTNAQGQEFGACCPAGTTGRQLQFNGRRIARCCQPGSTAQIVDFNGQPVSACCPAGSTLSAIQSGTQVLGICCPAGSVSAISVNSGAVVCCPAASVVVAQGQRFCN
jgi:hypothetical protein